MKKLTKDQVEKADRWLASLLNGQELDIPLMLWDRLAEILQYTPEPVDGDLIEKMCGSYNYGTFDEQPTRMIAVAKVCLDAALGPVTDQEATWAGTARQQYGMMATLTQFIDIRRSRLLRKEPEERITVEEVHTTPLNYSSDCAFTVTFDGKPSGPLHSCRKYAEIYADGLRFRLAKEKEAK